MADNCQRGDGHPPNKQQISRWPEGGLECVKFCPVCGLTERKLLYEGLTDRIFLCAPGEWKLYSCSNCNSSYLDPRPTSETVHLAYSSYFTHKLPGAPALATITGAGRLRRSLANGYRNWRFNSRFHPATKFGVLITLALLRQRARIDQKLRHIPRLRAGARLLDVGAGNGGFLAGARAVGWDVAGAEPDKTALAVARQQGLDIREGGIEQFSGEMATFDVITMSHVIEHVHHPVQVLRQALSLLKPRGCLYLDTPNVQSLGHRWYGSGWRGLEPPRHLILFNWLSLENLLREVGFTRIKRLPRTDICVRMATLSQAITEGCNITAQEPKPAFRDRLVGTISAARTQLRYRDSEFVTLLAYKGED